LSQQSRIRKPSSPSAIWAALCDEARSAAKADETLAGLMATTILNHDRLGDALSCHLARKLGDQDLDAMTLRRLIDEAYDVDPLVVATAEYDLKAIVELDPSCMGYVRPFLFFKGFLALQSYRVAHCFYGMGRGALASWLQSRSSELFHVDIHPAARIGRGTFIDHGTGIVIGATAVVGDGVSIMQGVTLGGVGVAHGDRHPSIGNGVLLSAGATVLGNIRIGDHAKIAAGSVVLRDVPSGCTAVGAPARLVNCPGDRQLTIDGKTMRLPSGAGPG